MRADKLRPVVITAAAKRLAVVVVVCVLMFVVYGINGSKEEEFNKADAALREENSQIQSIESYLDTAKKVMSQNQEGKQPVSYNGIDRNFLTESLDRLKSKYMLIGLSMRMGAIQPLKNEGLDKNSIELEHCLISINFSGLTDELLLSFTDNLLRIMPGYVVVDNIQMERKATMDEAAIKAVENENYPALVTGSIAFHWMMPKAKIKGAGDAAATAH